MFITKQKNASWKYGTVLHTVDSITYEKYQRYPVNIYLTATIVLGSVTYSTVGTKFGMAMSNYELSSLFQLGRYT